MSPFPYTFPFYFEPPLPYPYPTIQVRIAFVSNPFAASPTWVDVTNDVRRFSIRRGRLTELDRMEAGTATIELDNTSNNYYAENTGGTYTGNVRTMKRVNIRACYGGDTAIYFDLYTGYVESWEPDWLSEVGHLGHIMTVKCVDGLKCLSRLELNDAVGEVEEASGVRVANVLDTLGWMAADRTLSGGQYLMIATGALANVNALDHLYTVLDSEIGILYIGANGYMNFEDRSHRNTAPHTTSQSTWGDDAAELPYTGLELVLDETLLYNDVRATRSGGTQQSAVNSTSQTLYGVRTLTRTGLLLTTDVFALNYATYLVARYSGIATRVQSITINSGNDPANTLLKQLEYEISTRITVRLDEAMIDKAYFIEGIDHDWNAEDRILITKWQLSDATQSYPTPGNITETVRPTGAGDNTGIGDLVDTSHWQAVSEVTPDDETTYVWNNGGAGNGWDTYATGNIAASSATIVSVKVYVRCKQIGSTADMQMKCAPLVKTEGTTYADPPGGIDNLTTSWANYSYTWATNPNTGVAWTLAQVQAMQIGVWITQWPGGAWDERAKCTQVYAEVVYTPVW